MRRRLLGTFSASTLACLILAVGVAAALGPDAGPPTNRDVSAWPGNEAEDAIAANPKNGDNVVAITILDAPSGLFEGISFDGGKTWTRKIIGVGDELGTICCDEQLAWDRYGNLWMTYLLNDSRNVPVAVSTDGGLTFTKVAEIVPTTPPGSSVTAGSVGKRPGSPDAQPSADQPSIAVGPDSVWVSYASYPSGLIQAAGAHVRGLGDFGPFSSPETVPAPNGLGNYGDTAVGPDGEVLVIYQRHDGGEHGGPIYTALDPDGLGPAGFREPRFFAKSAVGGFDYIPAQPHRSVDAEANLAWDREGAHKGRVYAIWTQEQPDESDNTDIMFQYSDDAGRHWTPALKLNDDITARSQFNPAIALDQATGDVAVSWYDARNDAGDGGPGDTDGLPNDDVQIWATYSTDGGVTFARNFKVSERTSNANGAQSNFDYGDYTHAAFQDHAFYPAWSDNSNSTRENPDGRLHKLDLYTARVIIR